MGTRYDFNLYPALGSMWVTRSSVIRFPDDVQMMIMIGGKDPKNYPDGKPWAATLGTFHPSTEWEGADVSRVHMRFLKNWRFAPVSGWTITADMLATKKDGTLVCLRTFSLADGAVGREVNKYFTVTNEEMQQNDGVPDKERFRFRFQVTCSPASLSGSKGSP
ncbi:hypothetical protein T484DRAFT_1756372 [Baffinella frigidus]|nr:hypothetical protein T484DRAFT_1756372 [Cryptophyta sp. CCMP2293]